MNEQMTRISLDLTPELHKQLKIYCIKKGMTLSQFLRAMIQDVLYKQGEE